MNYPEMCYVYVASMDQIGVIKWGENGYYFTDIAPGDSPKDLVSHLNTNLGVSDSQAEAMMICSMAGPADWQKHYEMILSHAN